MPHKPIIDSVIEIEEFDQANNLVATYIQSPFNANGRRVDAVVKSPSFKELRKNVISDYRARFQRTPIAMLGVSSMRSYQRGIRIV